MYFRVLALAVIFFGSSKLLANSNGSWLRKVSIHLTGTPPTSKDLEEIATLSGDDVQRYIEGKVKEYQASPNYSEKMRSRLNELFRTQVSLLGHEDILGKVSQLADNMIDAENSTLDLLFLKIINENLSWDRLLLEKELLVPIKSPYQGRRAFRRKISDLQFYSYLYREELKGVSEQDEDDGESSDSKNQNVKISPKNEDQRNSTSGTITTNRFFTRYPTTKLNKNRKRSAAIYRIFMCNDMRPVVITNKSENQELLNLSINNVHDQLKENSDEKRHGEDEQCMSCHLELDSITQTLSGSSKFLYNKPSKGRFTYRREDGSLVDEKVNGIGEVGEIITQQPEYLNCQVSHFWNWFIGQDVFLSRSRKLELAKVFDEMGRKPNEFISYLVTRKEFINPEPLSEDKITYNHVLPLLKRCDSCHGEDPLAPVLSQGYPYSPNQGMNAFVIGAIELSTDLHESGGGYMPPDSAGWKLEGRDRALLKAWIRGGAKSSDGKVLLPGNAIARYKQSIPMKVKFSETFEASFQDTHKRYLENYDLVITLKELFGSNSVVHSCINTVVEAPEETGILAPLTGLPISKYVNSNYFKYLKNCLYGVLHSYSIERKNLEFLLRDELETLANEKFKDYPVFTGDLVDDKGRSPEQIRFDYMFDYLTWKDLSLANKRLFIEKIYLKFIGHGVLPEAQKNKLITKALKVTNYMIDENINMGGESLSRAFLWGGYTVLMSEEFLTF